MVFIMHSFKKSTITLGKTDSKSDRYKYERQNSKENTVPVQKMGRHNAETNLSAPACPGRRLVGVQCGWAVGGI